MTTKPFDISKFRKGITKAIDGLSIGFNDPTDWVSTGNYALNYRISNDFNKGIPLGKVTVFAGESGAGKSYICSGNLVKHAQEQGIYVVLIDSENALDEAWLHALGVDTSESKLLKLNMAMIDDVAKTISEFMKEYKTLPEGDKPKVLFVIDSLGMLLTPTDVNQFEAGDMKGDMGRKPKALTALVRNCVNMFGSHNVGLVATNHTYASQDMFDPDDKISGGQGFVYASSIVVAIKKLKLKEDEDGNKISEVRGIRAACKVMKTRYAKPFESVQVKIPYETGMNPYSGLLDMFEAMGRVKKEGNSLVYTTLDGTIIKKFRKAWEANTEGCLDTIMTEFVRKTADVVPVDESQGEEEPVT
jgi:recombination protein RecA